MGVREKLEGWKENLEFWRDGQGGQGRGCGYALLFLVGFFFIARIGGGVMGDYGGGMPAQNARHERELSAGFRESFAGLALAVGAAVWWSKGVKKLR